MPSYIPQRGDLVYLSFDPQAGHEQAGKRPALILSPQSYNRKLGMAICCPVTSQVKGYPFEVVIPAGHKINGVILADHIKNLDWQARQARFIERIPDDTLQEVLNKLSTLLALKPEGAPRGKAD